MIESIVCSLYHINIISLEFIFNSRTNYNKLDPNSKKKKKKKINITEYPPIKYLPYLASNINNKERMKWCSASSSQSNY